MKFGTWLAGMMSPLIAKIFVALGMSLVSIVGVQAALQTVKDALISNVNSMPADFLNMFLLAGGGTCLGIIFGAYTTRIAIWQIQAATKIIATAAS
ncbi:MAG: DUF2523 domain-containing protein [Polynucleobacter sp.]|uniref:DUF2523 domain-containing protein n=1 Tax=Polynucleobacter sp. TaxID=2029855 RepID=UPI00271B9C5B|nr:DUF2523 domain-containing protein [Polynucleobacter sp.]MDO8713134.1 DUF2523 domain-containing protein [Polynucleobacter sp.]